MSKEVVITAKLEGVDEVTNGFRRIGAESENMSKQIRGMARDIASLGASAVAVGKLGEQFGLLTKEQANVITTMGSMVALTATVVRGLATLEKTSWAVTLAEKARGTAHAFADTMASGITKIASAVVGALVAIKTSSIATAVAENARAVAHAIANAVATLGVAVPIIIAAAAAAAVGVMAYTGSIPGLAEGGIVYRPTYALVGEREPELIMPLSKMINTTSSAKSVYIAPGAIVINEARVPRETASAVIDELRRAGAID